MHSRRASSPCPMSMVPAYGSLPRARVRGPGPQGRSIRAAVPATLSRRDRRPRRARSLVRRWLGHGRHCATESSGGQSGFGWPDRRAPRAWSSMIPPGPRSYCSVWWSQLGRRSTSDCHTSIEVERIELAVVGGAVSRDVGRWCTLALYAGRAVRSPGVEPTSLTRTN